MSSDYSKRGIRKKQRSLHMYSIKITRKILLLILYLALVGFIGLVAVGMSLGFGVFKGVIDTSPSIENVDVTPTGFSTFVYDNEGNQIAKLISQDSNRIPVTMDMIPENLAHAFVAIEDERFYEHNGIDIKGIIRAAYVGISNGFHFSEGASTITQQLLKNNVFTSWTSENSFVERMKRKIQEQYLAIELSKSMSKDDVLLNYMNTINLGSNTLGVQAASLRYFNKSVSSLTLSECAVIAGITQNPTKYNPITHPKENEQRRQKVLKNMLEQKYITQAEYDAAIADDVYSRIQVADLDNKETSINSYFVDALTEDVLADLRDKGMTENQAFTLLYSGGLKIYSTQDPEIQAICDEVFSNEENYPANVKWYLNYRLTVKKANGDFENHSSEKYRRYFRENVSRSFDMIYSSQEDAYAAIEEYKLAILEPGDEVFDEKVTLTPQPQVSITVEDQYTGQIVAMVGGRGVKEGSRTLNRATSSKRQPGSTFKIVAGYAPAFDTGMMTLATGINDAPFNYSNGRPVSNWYSGYRGLSNARQGIIDSMNILAVKTLTYVSAQVCFDYVKNFGFTTVVDREERTWNGETVIYSDIQQSLVLGGLTYGVTNEELNAAYAAIANHGEYIKPKLYTKVVDHDGNVVLDNTLPQTRQVVKETTAYLLTSAMQTVVTSGTGGAVNFGGGMAIAGKTGTTSDYNDVWFAGYTPYYTASCWTGYDNNTKLSSNDEKNLAKKLWKAVMSRVHANLEPRQFERPAGIVSATVCGISGKLPIPGLCDAHIKSEIFAEGTVPTETCDVHYSGMVCSLDGLPATDMCPFKIEGSVVVLPNNILMSGDANAGNLVNNVTPDDGEVVDLTTRCHHDWEFMSQPGIEMIIENERIQAQINAQQAAQENADLLRQYEEALAKMNQGGDTGDG
ncbi:MAG: transglycosylase domain-containing protein [Lachnospiraceae bacterium]|nr:transglycosylase domain-containing protein [Lachnospiraceae bacterium]